MAHADEPPDDEMEALRRHFGRLAGVVEARSLQEVNDARAVEFVAEYCRSLRPILAYELILTPNGAEPMHPPVAAALAQTPLGFERARCYVRDGLFGVACYDIIALTWRMPGGSLVLLEDPAHSWSGAPQDWVGFRSPDSDGVEVVSFLDLPIQDAREAARSDYSIFDFRHNRLPHHKNYEPSIQVCRAVLREIPSVIATLEGAILADVDDAAPVLDNRLHPLPSPTGRFRSPRQVRITEETPAAEQSLIERTGAQRSLPAPRKRPGDELLTRRDPADTRPRVSRVRPESGREVVRRHPRDLQ